VQLREILPHQDRGIIRWAFLVELEGSKGTRWHLADLLARPILPLYRRDGRFGDIIIGRGPGVHAPIHHGSVSIQHARVRPFPDGSWQIVDQESTNGTFVNGYRLIPKVSFRLVEGSIVRFGGKRFVFGSTRLQGLLNNLAAQRPDQRMEQEPTLAYPDESAAMQPWRNATA